MSTVKLLCFAILLAGAVLLQGCSGDCTKASDCAADEVCYNEICQKSFSSFFENSCQVDSDCDGNGDGQTEYFCELGRCRLRNTMPVMVPDTGVTDTGTTTGADN
jgi:hypothetical protein